MRSAKIAFSLSILFLGMSAQKPEKIYGNARQHKPLSYYKEQAVAWKKEVDKNPRDPNAWYNYYYVNRNLFFNDTTDVRTPKEKKEAIQKLVDEMGKNVSESYEFNLCKWMAGGFDPNLLPYLKKAAELGEGRTEHIDFMINNAELDRKISDRELYSIKKFEAGQFSTGIIYYNYNVLMGLGKNAILITDGDNDTYPIWLLQAQGVRKDVTVLNLNLLMLDDYRDKLFAELGIKKWQRNTDQKGQRCGTGQEQFENGIIKHIVSNSKNNPVCIALTAVCHEKYIESVMENLYLTGLAYLYSEKPVDNMALLKHNAEQLYALDYIDKTFYNDISPDMVKLINGNYIVPLLKLYDHYHLSGETQREEWAKNKLLAVSKGTRSEDDVLKHLAQSQ